MTNLRILKQSLNDFKKIYGFIDETYLTRNYAIIQTMLIFIIAISFEIKLDKTQMENFKNIRDNKEYQAILDEQENITDKTYFIREFDTNYYYNCRANYRFFKSIEYYVRTRKFDINLLKQDLYDAEIEETLENVRVGEMELKEMVKLYVYFISFYENNQLSYDLEDLNKVFISGMNISAEHSNYLPNAKEEVVKMPLYNSNLASEMKEVLDTFYKLNESILKDRNELRAEEILSLMPKKMDQFFDKLDSECSDMPIFKYITPKRLFDKILETNNEDIVILKKKILERAEHYPDMMKQEKRNIKQVKKMIDKYLDKQEMNIQTVILKNFADDLEKIV